MTPDKWRFMFIFFAEATLPTKCELSKGAERRKNFKKRFFSLFVQVEKPQRKLFIAIFFSIGCSLCFIIEYRMPILKCTIISKSYLC